MVAPNTAVLNHGTYSLGLGNFSRWTLGAGAPGVLGRDQPQYLGAYDLRPWQGDPPGWQGGLTVGGVADDYRRAVRKVDTGNASVRFSLPDAKNPLNLELSGGVVYQYGSKTDTEVWTNDHDGGANRTVYALSIMVCATDSLEPDGTAWRLISSTDWSTLGSATAGNTGAPAEFPFEYMTVGPEVMSQLAQGSAAEYDLHELGGGARFVAVWLMGYWVGADSGATRGRVSWVVEDSPGAQRQGPTSYAWPVRVIQGGAGAVAVEPRNVVAQLAFKNNGLRQANGYVTQAAAQGAPVTLAIANGGDTFNAEIGYYIGMARDPDEVTETAIAVAVAGNAVVTQVPLGAAGTYPYQYLVIAAQSATAAQAGPAIVFATVS
jgi:hypothetical protein